MIQLDASYNVSAFLLLVAARQERDIHYNVYWEDRDDRDPAPGDAFLVAAPTEVQGDTMVFPQAVQQRSWWLYCSDELVRSVVDLAIAQKPAATPSDLLLCLVHYMHEDAFLSLV